MRIIRFLILYVMVSVLGCMVLIFLALNHYTIQIDLVRAQYPVNVALVMMGAALFGFVIALLLLLPGRLAAGLHVRARHGLPAGDRNLDRQRRRDALGQRDDVRQHPDRAAGGMPECVGDHHYLRSGRWPPPSAGLLLGRLCSTPILRCSNAAAPTTRR